MKFLESIINNAKLATAWDVIDILIVAFLLYRLMRFLRNTNAQKLLYGLIAVIMILELSDVMHLYVIHYILEAVMQVGILALVVIFQPELRKALEQVAERYDYIFIDCPPSLGMITLNALCAADGVLIPIQCEYFALEGVSALMGTIQKVQKMNRHLAIEGVVLTMFDARTNLSEQVVLEVKKFFKNKVYDTIIPRSVRLGEAPSFGMPINKYDPKSVGAKAYDALARELVEKEK